MDTDIVIASPEEQTAPVVHETTQLPRSIFAMTQDQFNRLTILAKMYSLSSFNNAKKPMSEGDFFLIMLKGIELGLMPTLAVDFINVISGKPVLDGKGMLALIYSSGVCESLEIDSQPEICTVRGNRKGHVEQVVTFTKADAMASMITEWVNGAQKKIPLWEKENWKNQPAVMLKWRAVSKFARQVFPDVIGGLYTKEEMEANVDVLEDGTEIAKPVPQAQLQQPKPQQQKSAQQPANAQPKSEWGSEESINKLVDWAKEKKYGTNVADLLKLVGKDDWKAFADGRQACLAIETAHAQKAQAPASKPAPEPAPTQGKLTDAEGNFVTNLVTTIGDAKSIRYLEFASGHLTARSYSRKDTATKMAGILPDDELASINTLEFDYEPYRLSRHFKVFYKVANNYNLVTRFEAVGTIDSHDTVDTTDEPPANLPIIEEEGDLDAFFPRGGK